MGALRRKDGPKRKK